MHNVGSVDQIVRIIVGLILLFAAMSPQVGTTDWLKTGLVLAAFWLLITGFVGVCPIYSLLKINTCPECLAEEELEYKLESERSLKTEPMTERKEAKPKVKKAAKKTTKKRTTAKRAKAKKAPAKRAKKPAKKKAGKKTTRKTTKNKKASSKKKRK